MRGQHPKRSQGSDHRAATVFTVGLEVPTTRGDISSAWAIAFVAVGLLGFLSAFA